MKIKVNQTQNKWFVFKETPFTNKGCTDLHTPDMSKVEVAPTVEKTEVFRKDWNFADRTYFAICVMRKHYFLLWMKKTAFFPYFYHGIIFYSAELFDCAVNFKFYLNIFIFLNINTNQTSKELRSSHYFGISRTKRFCGSSRPNVFSETY